jgi:putative membrane protein
MHSLPSPLSWNFDPLVLIAGVGLLGGYYFAVRSLRPRYSDEAVPLRRIKYFIIGVVSLLLVLCTPLDTLGRYYLLSAHTLQLLILTTITAPFLLMGLPEWLVTLLLPLRALRDATRGLVFPLLAALAFNVIIMAWHDGPLYEAALQNSLIYDLQMFCFLVAGILTWWPLLTPMDRHTRMSTPFQMLYLGIESLPLDIFGVIMIFAGSVFYTSYTSAPRIFGISPLVDQQIAGGLLAVPGNLLDVVLFSAIFFTWIQRQEIEQRARERELYAEEDAAAERVKVADMHSGEAGNPTLLAGASLAAAAPLPPYQTDTEIDSPGG